MKRKFLILTLCFTIIFSSINYKKSYAFPPAITLTPQVIGVIGAYSVACGVVFTSYDEIVNLSHSFYNSFSDNWDSFYDSFVKGVTIAKDNIVNISSSIKSKLDNFFSVYFSEDKNINMPIVYGQKFYIGNKSTMIDHGDDYYTKGVGIYGHFVNNSSNVGELDVYMQWPGSGTTFDSGFLLNGTKTGSVPVYPNGGVYISVNAPIDNISELYVYNYSGKHYYIGDFYNYGTLPLGVYNPDVLDKNINDDKSVDIYVPGNVGDLVGVSGGSTVYDGVLNPPYQLPNEGSVTVPNTNGLIVPGADTPFNPSIPDVNNPSVPDVNNPSIPDVNNPSIDGILPSFPSFGDSLDFSPMYLTNVTEKFPFSLPWDIGRLIKKFDVEPVAPVFEVPIVSETITLDLTEFSELASIVRFFVLIGFILALIFISTKLMA